MYISYMYESCISLQAITVQTKNGNCFQLYLTTRARFVVNLYILNPYNGKKMKQIGVKYFILFRQANIPV